MDQAAPLKKAEVVVEAVAGNRCRRGIVGRRIGVDVLRVPLERALGGEQMAVDAVNERRVPPTWQVHERAHVAERTAQAPGALVQQPHDAEVASLAGPLDGRAIGSRAAQDHLVLHRAKHAEAQSPGLADQLRCP